MILKFPDLYACERRHTATKDTKRYLLWLLSLSSTTRDANNSFEWILAFHISPAVASLLITWPSSGHLLVSFSLLVLPFPSPPTLIQLQIPVSRLTAQAVTLAISPSCLLPSFPSSNTCHLRLFPSDLILYLFLFFLTKKIRFRLGKWQIPFYSQIPVECGISHFQHTDSHTTQIRSPSPGRLPFRLRRQVLS